jgi:hypothetical protein
MHHRLAPNPAANNTASLISFANLAHTMKEPRKIFFEGKFVGEVPDTGDLQADLKVMSALLKARGVAVPLTRAQAAFRQAAAFAMNAQYLFNTGLIGVPPVNPINVIPFVVNAAFAAELYLKTLGCVYGQDKRGHDLLKLFDHLPAEAKELLRQEIARAPPTEGIKDLASFRVEIGQMRGLFEEWRYLHERDSSGVEIRFKELTHVLNVLHNTCRNHDQLKPVSREGTSARAQ